MLIHALEIHKLWVTRPDLVILGLAPRPVSGFGELSFLICLPEPFAFRGFFFLRLVSFQFFAVLALTSLSILAWDGERMWYVFVLLKHIAAKPQISNWRRMDSSRSSYSLLDWGIEETGDAIRLVHTCNLEATESGQQDDGLIAAEIRRLLSSRDYIFHPWATGRITLKHRPRKTLRP